MTHLKPCPFCGERASVVQASAVKADGLTKFVHWIVGCCGTYGSACPGYIWKDTPKYFSEEEAIKFWNSRKRLKVK